MNNLFISDLDLKDADHFTNPLEQRFRKKFNKCFRFILTLVDHTKVVIPKSQYAQSDEEYYASITHSYIPLSHYDLKQGRHNIIVERYPILQEDENYIFVGTHVCPEDIETMLNVIDRNTHLVLGSIDLQKHDPEIFLLWLLNGIIPFDILDKKERRDLIPKMLRVLKTNSILIFPEGSHNVSPNKLINHLFDGPVNVAEKSGCKIIIVAYLRDNDNNVSYLDFSNPVDIKNLNINIDYYYPGSPHNEKYRVKAKTEYLRDKMANAMYCLMERHFKQVQRKNYYDIEEYLRQSFVSDSLKKLNYTENVDFKAEYLTKQTTSEKNYNRALKNIYDLEMTYDYLLKNKADREIILKYLDSTRKNVPEYIENMLNRNA